MIQPPSSAFYCHCCPELRNLMLNSFAFKLSSSSRPSYIRSHSQPPQTTPWSINLSGLLPTESLPAYSPGCLGVAEPHGVLIHLIPLSTLRIRFVGGEFSIACNIQITDMSTSHLRTCCQSTASCFQIFFFFLEISCFLNFHFSQSVKFLKKMLWLKTFNWDNSINLIYLFFYKLGKYHYCLIFTRWYKLTHDLW